MRVVARRPLLKNGGYESTPRSLLKYSFIETRDYLGALVGISLLTASAIIGLAITVNAAVSMPLVAGVSGAARTEVSLVEKTVVVFRNPRRYSCRWSWGRRVRGWHG
jgi:hypothetical protein